MDGLLFITLKDRLRYCENEYKKICDSHGISMLEFLILHAFISNKKKPICAHRIHTLGICTVSSARLYLIKLSRKNYCITSTRANKFSTPQYEITQEGLSAINKTLEDIQKIEAKLLALLNLM